MKRQIFILILFICIALAAIASCSVGTDFFSPDTSSSSSIKTYREIPGVSQMEIAEIEAVKSSGRNLSYAAIPTTEAFMLPDGTYAGFAAKFCELLSDLFGIPFVLELHDWDALISALNTKAIDFTGHLTPTLTRRLIYSMSHPIAERSLAVFTCGDSVFIETEADLKGLRLGFLDGAVSSQSVMEVYPDLVFEAVFVKNVQDAAQMLVSGTIDAFIDFEIDSYSFADNDSIRAKGILPRVYSPVSLTTMKKDLEPFISVLNKYIEAGGIDVLYHLYEEGSLEYYRYNFRRSLTSEEVSYFDNLSRVPVALEADNYPVSFYDEPQRKFQGIAPDILTEVSKLTGIEFYEAASKNTTWAAMLEKLSSGEVSIISELLYSEGRKDNFLWSDRYASSRYALLSKIEYPNLKMYQVIRTRVGVGRKSAYEEMYRLWFPYNFNIKYYDTQNEALDALEKGEIDLLMGSESMLLALRNYREKPGYKVNIRFDTPLEESYFGFNKNEELLRSVFCKAQRYVNSGKISDDWKTRIYDYSRRMAYERLVYSLGFAVILLLMLIILAVLFVKNSRTSKLYKEHMITISTIYKSLPDFVYTKDLDGRYTSCNEELEKHIGLPESEIVGKTLKELSLTNPDSVAQFEADDKVAMKKNMVVKVENWIEFPGKHPKKLYEVTKAPLFHGGNVIGMLGIDRDITEYRDALKAAHDASRAKSNFLAKMSHEIRTPMNAIVGMAELALRSKELDSAKSHMVTVKQAGVHLLSIVNDILDFSKIEMGKLEIIEGAYLFSSLVNDVISIVRMRVIDSMVRFAVNIDSSIPNALYGDETRLRQVLLNLLSNAVKFTEKGFVSLTVHGELAGENTVNLVMEIMDSGKGIKQENIELLFGEYSQIDQEKNKGIEGTGLGLAITWNIVKAMGGDITVRSEYGKGSIFTVTLPQRIRVHEVLATVESTNELSVIVYERREIYANSLVFTLNNLGVDATLVSMDSELHAEMEKKSYSFIFIPFVLYERNIETIQKFGANAKIVVLTDFGVGLPGKNYTVLAMPVYSIPIANILNGISGSFVYNESSDHVIRFTAPDAKVLIVDDINTNLKVAEGLMLPYKVQVDLAKSGEETIEKIKYRRYDLVFMDHKMPGMDGVETTLRIRGMGRKEPYYKHVPIIALTANAVFGTKEMFLSSGFNDFLSKPIDTTKLNSILEQWLPKEKQKSMAVQSRRAVPLNTYAAAVEIEIQGLDMKKGIFLSGGTVESFMETLSIFCKDGFEKLKDLKTYLEAKNLDLYTIHVHALKSASANIGAAKLSEKAAALEAAGERKNLEFVELHTPELFGALELLIDRINSALARYGADKAEKDKNYTPDLLEFNLGELKAGLLNLNAGIINQTIQELQKCAQSSDLSGRINNLADRILLGDYDEAVAMVNALLEIDKT